MPLVAARLETGDLARAMNHTHLGVEHLFLAIARDPAAVPTQVLAVSVDEVEASLLALMTSLGYATPSREVRWPAP